MKRELFKPKWNDPCLCASGKKYRDCCWQRRPGFDIGKEYLTAIKDKNLERALQMCRADIVQYTIWHKTNTEPALFRGGPVLKLLRIDVNALADYVERLLWLYIRTDRALEWLDVIERLRKNIQHPWWQRKIAYYRAISHLGPAGDRAKARHELKKVGPVTKSEDDIAILQLYLDLELDDEPFAQRMALLDRLLEISGKRSDQLQYRGAKAVQYFLIQDKATAESELVRAIDVVRNMVEDDPLSAHERLLAGRLIQMLGSLRNDSGLFKEAIGHFNALLLQDQWTQRGRAGIHREIGDTYKHQSDWTAAEAAYRDALAAEDNPLDHIHLAECALYQKRIDEAVSEITKIDRASLGQHEYDDFVFAFSAIAIWSEKDDLLRESREILKAAKITEPYFNERRLRLLVAVSETLASGNASPKAKADSTPASTVAATASSFFLLEPNIMGIGINFNAVIDYFMKKRPHE